MSDEATALRRCVGDVAGFEQAWGFRPLRMCQSNPAAFADIFGMHDVDELLSSGARAPVIRMVCGGEPLAPSRFCTRTRLGGRYLDDVIDPAKVTAELRDGATLVLQSLHRVRPEVARFVDELQDEIGHPVQANAYLTPPSATGLAPHADGHDVIVLQLVGTKNWTVEGLGDVTMGPGDSMYVPAGVTHSAHTGDDFSLHLTLGLIRVTRRDLITRALADLDALDTPLPIGFRSASPESLRQVVSTALAETRHHLEGVDPDEVVEREQRRRLARPTDRGRVGSMLGSATVAGDSMIRWAGAPPQARLASASGSPGPWVLIETMRFTDDDHVDVHVGRRVLTVPGGAVEAISFVARLRSCRVDELPGLDEPSQLVVAERLLRETVCVFDERPSDHRTPG